MSGTEFQSGASREGLLPEELFIRLGLLIRLRWAGEAFLGAFIVYLLAFYNEVNFYPGLLSILFGVGLLFNLAFHLDLKKQRFELAAAKLQKTLNLQFYFDVFFYLAFVYLTGGALSPFFMLMVFPAVSATLIFVPPFSYIRLALVLFLFGILLFMQVAAEIFPPLMLASSLRENSIFAFASLSSAAGFLAYLLSSLVRSLKQKIGKLTELHASLKSSSFETVMALARAVEAKQPELRHHIDNSVRYAELLGARLGLSKEEMELLRFGVVLHDIGKIAVEEKILLKPSVLSQEEFEKVKQHPEQGLRIIEGLDFLRGVEPIILSHHERFDGKGYPAGLKGEEINFLARVVSVIDSFEAMTSSRRYAPSKNLEEVKKEISRERGRQFDPKIADAFLDVLESIAPEFR